MRAPFVFILLTCSVVICRAQSETAYSATDFRQLSDLPVKWLKYWNHHEMDSMGTMLRDDVNFINVAGVWLKGKVQVIADHKEKHRNYRFSKSVWTTDSVRIEFVKQDLAIIRIGWGISGDYENETTPRPPHHGLFTWVVTKESRQWCLLSAQNTNIR